MGSVRDSVTRRLRLASSRDRLFDRLFRGRRDRLFERRYLDLVFRLGRTDFQRSLLLAPRDRRYRAGWTALPADSEVAAVGTCTVELRQQCNCYRLGLELPITPTRE
jgi:hypothetical protein